MVRMELERRVGEKGQVVIPKDARKKLGIRAGTEVVFEVEGDKLMIKKKESPEEFLKRFGDVPERLRKHMSIKERKALLDEEYGLR